MNGWFAELFPDVSFPAERISGVISRTKAQFQTLQKEGGNIETFLQEERDLDKVSEILSHLGLKRGQLLADVKKVDHPEGFHFQCTNQVIIDLENFRSREKLASKFIVMWSQLLSPGESIDETEISIKKVINQYRTLNRHRSRAPDKVISFLSSRFPAAKSPPSSSSTTSQPSPPSDTTDDPSKMRKLQQEKDFLSQCSIFMRNDIQTLEQTVHELGVEKNKLLEVPNTIRALQQELDKAKESYNTLRRTKQVRYDTKRRLCNETKRRLQQEQKVADELRVRQNQLQRNVQLLSRDLERERQTCESLRLLTQQLTEEVDKVNVAQTRVKHENNRFSDAVRKTVLELQGDANVPASRCSAVIKIVSANMFNQHFNDSDLPCLQTAINIADEGQVLAKIQATEAILSASNCTIHTDGTSRDTKKIVGQQITLNTGETLSLGFTPVASEDATTLLEMTTSQLQEMGDLYCDAMDDDKEQIFKELLKKTYQLHDRPCCSYEEV